MIVPDYSSIINHIRTIGNFTDVHVQLFIQYLTPVSLSKDSWILKEGQTCKSFFFIRKGAVRQYLIDEHGNEYTTGLYIENQFALNQQSFIKQQPSVSNIVTTTDCELFEFNVHGLHDLIQQSQAFFQLGKLLEQEHSYHTHYEHLTSPEEKYRLLLQQQPELLNQFPLKHVASYLKMTPETLSRVRNKITKRVD